MLRTTIAGSLPKPAWLAGPRSCGRRGALPAETLAAGQRDAVLIGAQGAGGRRHRHRHRRRAVAAALRARVPRGARRASTSRKRVTIGIRADRYKAEVPTVTGPVARRRPVHLDEVRCARAHTDRRAQVHDPRADDDRGHARRRALPRPRAAGDGVRRASSTRRRASCEAPASTCSSSTSRRSMCTWTMCATWGIEALHRAIEGLPARRPSTSATATGSRPTSTGSRRSAASGASTSRRSRCSRRAAIDQVSLECAELARADLAARAARRQGRAGRRASTWRRDRSRRPRRWRRRSGRRSITWPPERLYPCTNCGMVPLAREVARAKLHALAAGARLVRGRARPADEKGPSASLAPSAARSTYREYASRAARRAPPRIWTFLISRRGCRSLRARQSGQRSRRQR